MANNLQTVLTLEIEIKKFANSLPYWTKYLAEKILSGNSVSDSNIDTSYYYLLEELGLKAKTQRPELIINYNSANQNSYETDLQFSKLENVEGVNALKENQTLEFCSHLTLVYGANGSGKSGYIRLLKKAFYSKSPEEILPNIHATNINKTISAKFVFTVKGKQISLKYPNDESASEFEQFAIFDGKSVIKHLEQRNEFEFRPAGLNFFADYTDCVNKVETKLNAEINLKQSGYSVNDISSLFEGDSEIKIFIQTLSASTKIEDLAKHTPFSEKDKTKKETIQKKYDELLLASKGKDKEIKNLENIKKLLGDSKKTIEALNHYFSTEALTKINSSINDFQTKETLAKTEGIENFKTDKIEGIGTKEWKDFIIAAKTFSIKQKPENIIYPETADNCLLCQQPLSRNAEILINNYWKFIKSVAEEDLNKTQASLQKIKVAFEKLNFQIFPEENTLTTWLTEKYPEQLKSLQQQLSQQKKLTENILIDIEKKAVNFYSETKVNVDDYSTIDEAIDNSLKIILENKESKQLEELAKEKRFLEHKEKYNFHFAKIQTYVDNQIWIRKAGKVNYSKRQITDTEKTLSLKYFNQKYIDAFNEECNRLNGNFGIEISHTGTAGKSYRQLKLKGRSPNTVLSEGEQKVIAIADFIAEMKLSEVNRGIIFDDPVTSLDDTRKSEIACRLANEAKTKQVIIFTHDLVFVSSIITHCKDLLIANDCHWIEALDKQPGIVWLKNAPSLEKEYKASTKAINYYNEAKNLAPELRETKIKNGFGSLRTNYEALVVFGLFNGVVQRFEERVSVMSLDKVIFTDDIRDEVLDSFAQCCSYMEGHSHSDKYSSKKPSVENLLEEIKRFDTLKKKISDLKKL